MKLYQQSFPRDGKPALVLLHGWGMYADVWQPVLESLQQHFSVYLYDLPGLGRSSGLSLEYSFTALADAILQEAPEQAHWLGWSLGGTVALAAAVRAPERVLSLVTVASNPCFVQRDGWQQGMPAGVFFEFQSSLAEDCQKTLTRFVMLQTQGALLGRETLRSLKKQLALYKTQLPAALAETLALLAQDQRDLVSQIRCPMLAIWGELDQLVPVSIQSQFEQLNPAVEQQVFASAGHLPFYSHTDQFVARLCQFVGLNHGE